MLCFPLGPAHISGMTNRRTTVSNWAIWGLYFFTFVLVFWPVADLATNTWPIQPSSLLWRYGFMGLLAGFLHTPILGLAVAMCLSYAMSHRSVLRILSMFSLLGAAVLSAVLVVFALDVLQLRGTVEPERLPSFQVGAMIAELKHLTSFLALMFLGIGGLKTVALTRVPKVERAADQSSMVLASPRTI